MKKTLTTAVIISAVFLFTASSFAQPFQMEKRGHGFMKQSPGRIVRVLEAKQDELKITDKQLDQIKNLVFSFEEHAVKMGNANNLKHLELKKLLQDRENLDYKKIKVVLSELSDSKQEMFITRLQLREEIQSILSPEQREALKEMWKERPEGRRSFMRGERQGRFPRMREKRDE
jgi:Spy/CpxP family protein refolding chaperone